MASLYLRTPPPPPSSQPLTTSRQVRSFGTLARSGRTSGSGGITQEEEIQTSLPPVSVSGSLSSSRTQLDLLDRLAGSTSDSEGYESESNSDVPTIREQLAWLVRDREGDFSIPLGKNLKKVSEKFLTVSQKRNIKRQAYLNEVSQRNDSMFFATVGAFVILPPVVILGIAISTGYVQLFP
ncbi:hypothetical protein MLD38_007291 [Melastoma candidum]|uniref:Uncharacterized protein n=1 Tax=Melastoma candidum TaxID=119954 RepID=A0ACB9RQB3_9MYRT|nr:hypothetical protein MLD38_007291 [Melastoma candidum]